jgi:uncharacterized protein YjiS (DUF1127 family)
MPRQRLGAFGNPGPIEDDLEQGAIYDASADEIAANLTRVLDAFEEYQDARAELRLSDRDLMRAFFGHMVKSGYAPGTINGWRRLLDTHHVTPRNIAEVRARLDVSAFLKAVDTVSGRTPRDDRRTGVTLEHVARFCVGFDGDAPRDLEYRAFMFMLIVTGNRPRHVRELDYIKLQGTKGVTVRWFKRKIQEQMQNTTTYPYYWSISPPLDVAAFLKRWTCWTISTPAGIAGAMNAWLKRRAARMEVAPVLPTHPRGILSSRLAERVRRREMREKDFSAIMDHTYETSGRTYQREQQ